MNKRNVLLLLLLLDICTIFAFSFFSAQSSHVQSKNVTAVLKPVASSIGIYGSDFKGVSSFYHYKDISLSELLVRKLAHFSEYFVLAIFTGLFASSLSDKRKRIALVALMGILIALTDEGVIQLFLSSGRSASFKDVLVDVSGYFTGILTFILCSRIVRYLLSRRAHSAHSAQEEAAKS